MSSEASTMEFVGRVAMTWIEDYAENPKPGSYMEAVADLTTRILGGAVEASGLASDEASEVKGRLLPVPEEAQAG
ncbi:hypothetical protein [uncultured Arthrobacter sp.]|uniref:hypothetical protein n=1 Tax=uncultured Arthrobacter sp. TaxID=114050 RepID=UPI0028D3AF72|nr:hypothetical protein [uncultured Arthrobacter sp.]